MQAVPIGTLHDEEVEAMDGRPRAEQRHRLAADIPCEAERDRPPALLHPEDDDRRTEDVAGVPEGERHPGQELQRAIIAEAHELPEGPLRLLPAVEGLDRRRVVLRALAVQVLGVVRLDVRAVEEEDSAEVARGVGRVDRAVESILAERGDIAAVVDVGVGENETVDAGGIDGEHSIPLRCLLPSPLKEAAIEEYPPPGRLDEMHRAGDLARPAVKGDLHLFTSL
jgi:hypothetical protein